MKKKRSCQKTYKGIYERATGLSVPRWWHIHHIDEDPTNNDINNLVATTPEVHLQFHNTGDKISGDGITPIAAGHDKSVYLYIYYEELGAFVKWQEIMSYFVDYRDFLLGKIVNHNGVDYELLHQLYSKPKLND